jgi:hypothetical protein
MGRITKYGHHYSLDPDATPPLRATRRQGS